MSGVAFEQIYAIVEQIPPGKVATYGQIAALAGMPRSARIVGYAMAACPMDSPIPCHRVVDRLGHTKAAFDRAAPGTQQALLELEGVRFAAPGQVDLAACRWDGTLYRIRYAELSDLPALVNIEAVCFPPAEAARAESLKARLTAFPHHFWLLEQDGKIVSFVNGMVTNCPDLRDEMYADASLHEESG